MPASRDYCRRASVVPAVWLPMLHNQAFRVHQLVGRVGGRRQPSPLSVKEAATLRRPPRGPTPKCPSRSKSPATGPRWAPLLRKEIPLALRMTAPPRHIRRSDLPQPRWWPRSRQRVSHDRRRLKAAPFLRGDNDRHYSAGKIPGVKSRLLGLSSHLVTRPCWSPVKFGHR